VLVTGASGYLGGYLVTQAPPHLDLHLVQHLAPVTAARPGMAIHTLDLADGHAVDTMFAQARPDVVIHAAASTATDRLESAIARSTENVCAASAHCGAYLVHVSTDMVFDGEHSPYTELHAPSPISAYGRAKAAAESRVLADLPGRATVVRTSLIAGAEPLDPRSEWVARALQGEGKIPLFVDELRCPIWVEDLAAALWELALRHSREPIIHVAGPEAISRYALGLLIANCMGLSPANIVPAPSRSYQPPRPRDLRLDTRLACRLLDRRIRPISDVFARETG
jgi:dTDP-4-dehydrorhamnose reductase